MFSINFTYKVDLFQKRRQAAGRRNRGWKSLAEADFLEEESRRGRRGLSFQIGTNVIY